jgi:hypothetical protein
MATYDASVKKALTASQRDLIDHKEHCSADPVKLATVGRERGHQVRIKRNDSEYGLYTSDEFVGSLDSQVPLCMIEESYRGADRSPASRA